VKIAQEASKQCGRGAPLAVDRIESLESFVQACRSPSKWIAVPSGPERLAELLLRDGPLAEAAVLVGPEGGFTPEEVAKASRAGFEPLGLPTPVLRTPTAVALLGALGVWARMRWAEAAPGG